MHDCTVHDSLQNDTLLVSCIGILYVHEAFAIEHESEISYKNIVPCCCTRIMLQLGTNFLFIHTCTHSTLRYMHSHKNRNTEKIEVFDIAKNEFIINNKKEKKA